MLFGDTSRTSVPIRCSKWSWIETDITSQAPFKFDLYDRVYAFVCLCVAHTVRVLQTESAERTRAEEDQKGRQPALYYGIQKRAAIVQTCLRLGDLV